MWKQNARCTFHCGPLLGFLQDLLGRGLGFLFSKLKTLWFWVQGIFSKIKLDGFEKSPRETVKNNIKNSYPTTISTHMGLFGPLFNIGNNLESITKMFV
jgi:hypothetical protein